MTTADIWFHVVELGIMAFGVALPILWGVSRLASLLKDFPPHRHLNGSIIYPRGYEPTEIEHSK